MTLALTLTLTRHLADTLEVDELDVEEGAEEHEVLRLEVDAHELLGV